MLERQQNAKVPLILPISVKVSIFHGAFLDPASSAVYAVFLFTGIYAFAYLRAAKPRL